MFFVFAVYFVFNIDLCITFRFDVGFWFVGLMLKSSFFSSFSFEYVFVCLNVYVYVDVGYTFKIVLF